MKRFRDFLNELVDLPPAEVRFEKPGQNQEKIYTAPGVKFDLSKNHTTKLSNKLDLDKLAEIITEYENSKTNPKGGWNEKKGRWFPHKSVEGGSPTIAYGHKVLPGENFSSGISDAEALKLLRNDLLKKEKLAKEKIKNYDTLPGEYKMAILNAFYRGDIGPATIKLISSGKFGKVHSEYLDHAEYKSRRTSPQIKKRMNWNAEIFKKYGDIFDMISFKQFLRELYLGSCVDLTTQFEDDSDAAPWMLETLGDDENVIRISKEVFYRYVTESEVPRKAKTGRDAEFYYIKKRNIHPAGSSANFLLYSTDRTGNDIHYFFTVDKPIGDDILKSTLENGYGAGSKMGEM